MNERHVAFQVQKTLDDRKLPAQEKPWMGICCKRCYYAKTEKAKCKCRCHGINHQKGQVGLHRRIEMNSKLNKRVSENGKAAEASQG